VGTRFLASALCAALALAWFGPAGERLAAARAPDSGLLVVLDAKSGREIARVESNGVVDTAVADGHGGWFVGGSFTRFGGVGRVGLAHLLLDGAVDPAWRASIGGASGRRGSVTALARAGSRLFVAGAFGRVDGLDRPGLAAVDARTGAIVRSWSPSPRVWIDVQALLVAGPRLLVARNWTYPTPGITALDTRTGAVDQHWNPHLLLIGDAGSFNTLLLRNGRVYVAGSFRVAGLHRNGLVGLDARSGKPDLRWAPRVPNCSVCIGFAVLYGLAASGRRVYVSGAFRQIDGVRRAGVAALDARTGAIDRTWRPAGGGIDVYRLALAGSRLYLGSSNGLSALDADSGAQVSLPVGSALLEVLTLTVSGGRLLVTGRV
jgi:hypothetical protein